MKKLLSIALCAAAAAAFADEISLGEVGVTKIETSTSNTIIAVSYQDLASGDVAISNLVKTTNLAVGDQMAVFNDGVYETWTLAEGEGDAPKPKYWAKNEKQYTLDGDGNLIVVDPSEASIVTKSVGTGLWIIQTGTPVQPIYLYGKPSTVTQYDCGTGATLVGNPLQNPAVPKITGMANGDKVVVPSDTAMGRTEYIYVSKKSCWGLADSTGAMHVATLPTIPEGTGFWYVSKGSSAKISWDNN